MTTGTTNATAPATGTAPTATGTGSTPGAGAAMPDGVTSLFAAISPVSAPPVLPPPEGIKPVVAKTTPSQPSQRLVQQPQDEGQDQPPSLPAIPEDVELEVLPPVPAEETGVGVYTAMDAEAASEIAQAINSGMIVRDKPPALFLP